MEIVQEVPKKYDSGYLGIVPYLIMAIVCLALPIGKFVAFAYFFGMMFIIHFKNIGLNLYDSNEIKYYFMKKIGGYK